MPTIVETKTMNGLWKKINNRILWAKRDELAYISSLDTMMEDCMALTDSCKYSIDIGQDLWLTPVRWTTLINQYVDPESLAVFLQQISDVGVKKRGIIAMDMKNVRMTLVETSKRATRRKHGGCMRMLVYRNDPFPTLSLYSRTSYLGYIGGLDMLLVHKIAEQVAEIHGIGVGDIRFRWHCEMWQFHGFKSFAYILTTPNRKLLMMKEWPEKKLGPIEQYPTWKLVRSWWKRITDKDKRGESYDDMKYGAEIRIRRRYHGAFGITGYGGPKIKESGPLSTPIGALTLDKVMIR